MRSRYKILAALASLLLVIICVESLDIFGFQRFQPIVAIGKAGNETVLTWQRLPYPACYEIEVLTRLPSADNGVAKTPYRLMHFHTFNNEWTLSQDFPFQTYWRVSASGFLRHPLGNWSEPVTIATAVTEQVAEFSAIKPLTTAKTTQIKTVGPQPILTWSVIPNAVYYEIEFLDQPPENPNGIEESKYRVFASRDVFVNGYNPDLRNLNTHILYWRVRGLDVQGNPIGVFSDAQQIRIDPKKIEPLKPLITSELSKKGTADLLYPVYSWIPLKETAVYEVELTRTLPENPNGTEPSRYRIWSSRAIGFASYDEFPRIEPGVYYYRVRGLTSDGDPFGVWSDVATFDVDLRRGHFAATFGDSITHGGGAISYSPADWAYDYQTYLKFPTYNLGRSGDTAETTAARFDADVLPFKPRYLIIMTGTNSLRASVEGESVIRDLQTIRDKCLANGIRPIFLTLPPINPDAIHRTFSEETSPNWQQELQTVNAWVRRQPYFVDLYPHFTDEAGELPDHFAIDGLHYDISGKRLMGTLINANWDRLTR